MPTNLYPILLTIHSYWRWLVLLAGAAAVIMGMAGWAKRLPFAPWGSRVSRLFVIAMDVQLVLGLWLYAVSPLVRDAWRNMAAAMKQHELRFFAVEHTMTMLIAVVLAHVGSWRCKRAPDDLGKYRNVLGWYLASLVVILAGIPWWRPLFRSLG
jgi:hypothetical protein